MPSRDEDLPDEPPPSIHPYQVLGVEEKATADEIKNAYRKQALRHHPDKAQPSDEDAANKKFQEIAFAYAILSDERRRRRYDATGNTSESLDLEDDDFNWTEFYREQYSSMVTGKALDAIKGEYQGSEEERRDIFSYYETFKGDLDRVYENVMLSNPLEDEDRFRKIIDKAIEDGEVKGWDKYLHETEKKKQQRMKRARLEGEEAKELAKELGVEEKLFGKKAKGKAKPDDEGLAALIQQRQKGRAANFLVDLEAKYGGRKKGGTGKKRGAEESEPPEEAFAEVGARMKKIREDGQKKRRSTAKAGSTASKSKKR